MTQTIRAVYERGQLRLLDPVNLTDGQEIQLMILSEREQARAALHDLLVQVVDPTDEGTDETAMAREIEASFRGQPPLSETIIEQRREGP